MGLTAKEHWSKLLTPMQTQIEKLQKENEELRAAAAIPGGNNEELLAQIEAMKEGAALLSGANQRLSTELETTNKYLQEALAKIKILEEQNTSLGEVLRVANKKNEELEAALKSSGPEDKPKAEKPKKK